MGAKSGYGFSGCWRWSMTVGSFVSGQQLGEELCFMD
jgi:hypothetical protein